MPEKRTELYRVVGIAHGEDGRHFVLFAEPDKTKNYSLAIELDEGGKHKAGVTDFFRENIGKVVEVDVGD